MLVVLWITFAILNVFYNIGKTIPEIKEWIFLSDDAKRQKLFGDIYAFYVFVNNHSEKNAKILFFPKDEMSFYLARYYLYPRIITRVDDEKKLQQLASMKTYSYIVSSKEITVHTYILVKQFGSEGYFYKRL